MTENVQNNSPDIPPKTKKKAGRPPGKVDDKAKMLQVLRRIWGDKNNKPSDIINAADEYAVLMGWKLKKTETQTENGTVIGVEFTQKSIQKPPEHKMIEKAPVIKIEPKAEVKPKEVMTEEITTTTTTAKTVVADNANSISLDLDVDSNAKPLNLDDL